YYPAGQNQAFWVGGGLALAIFLGLTSQSKGLADRWRFWSFVVVQSFGLRSSSHTGQPLTVTLGVQNEK
ncbi:MAG: hypothetical protein Q8M94_17010, partial [Ignavibacteria bacterium]|nr:hypothetical protein [Ignavibacteria bacterium]